MIVLDKADLRDQAGMERAFQGYFRQAKREFGDTFNGMLDVGLARCDYEKKTVTLAVDPKPWMANPMGILHGGITAALLDMTMGLLCRYYSGGYMTPTIGIDVQYLRSGPLDKKLCVRAELTKAGFSVCYATGSMWAEGAEDSLLATSSGAYYVARPATGKNEKH